MGEPRRIYGLLSKGIIDMKSKALVAEFIGTFWLVLGGVGSAVFAAQFFADDGGDIGIGLVGISLAFGLTVVTGAYAVGHISGGHFNPAVTLGLTAGGRFDAAKAPGYIVSQVLGAIAAAALLGFLVQEKAEGAIGTLASNGYGALSPSGYSAEAVVVAEIVLTAIFLVVIMGATSKRAAAGFGGLAIGLSLTLIHLISIPISNTSVNPARSTGPALIAAIDGTTEPLSQLWVFWLAPIVGGILGGIIYKYLLDDDTAIELDEIVLEEKERELSEA